MKQHLLSAICLAFAMLAPAASVAQSNAEMISARILPGWQQRDGSFVAGLELDLAPGWKTYWRAPGDAGIPPRFDWSGSQNVGALQMMWPTPKVMDQNGMTSIGYAADVVVPVVLRPRTKNQPMTIRGHLQLGVCREICVPASVRFEAVLQPGKGKREAALVAALVDQPLSAKEAGVGKVQCEITPVSGGLALTAKINMPKSGGAEHTIIETDNPSIWVAEAMTSRDGSRLEARTEMMHVEGKPFALNRSGIRITILGRDHAVDIRGCPGV